VVFKTSGEQIMLFLSLLVTAASITAISTFSWFGVLTKVLILLEYDAMSSDQVTNRHGIISQKTCFFNKLPFICFAVNVILRHFIVTQPPINAVICEQFSQYCVLNF